MAHNITIERAKYLYDKEMKLREMQKDGKSIPNSRRQKKYEIMRKKQDGRLWKIKDRILNTGGVVPEHLKEEK